MNISSLFITFIIPFFIPFGVNAQTQSNKDIWNVRAGYSRINNWRFRSGNIGEFSIESNHRANKWFEAGLYTGFSLSKSKKESYNETDYKTTQVLSYGINTHFYLSSLFLKDNSRLGFRIIMRPGGFIIFADNGFVPGGHYFSFRPGLGMDYQITKKVGVFGEYIYGFGDGNYRAIDKGEDSTGYKENTGSFRFGISFRF
ncbi:MAG: hypothetical protein LBL24_04750 [Bacteroidales bacterium]|jgi:hypothetical protein|nr:hypothetical protein [Bacteroidales bacterium]